jgi:hypothetical protein
LNSPRTATAASIASTIQAALTRAFHAAGARLAMTATIPAAAAAMTRPNVA